MFQVRISVVHSYYMGLHWECTDGRYFETESGQHGEVYVHSYFLKRKKKWLQKTQSIKEQLGTSFWIIVNLF